MVQDLIKEHGWGVALYSTMIGSSALVNNQLAKFPGVLNLARDLEEVVQQTTGASDNLMHLGEFGVGLMTLMAFNHYFLKKPAKREQVVKEMGVKKVEKKKEKEEKSKLVKVLKGSAKLAGSVLAKSSIPLAATATLFASSQVFPEAYQDIANYVRSRAETFGMDLQNLNTYVTNGLKLTGGLLGVLASQMLYKSRVKAKHGPTWRKIQVNGWMPISEKVSWTNWVRGRKIKIPGLGDNGTYLPGWAETTKPNQRVNVTVTAKDFPNGENKDTTYISYVTTLEPSKVDRSITPREIEKIVKHLENYILTHRAELGEEYFIENKAILAREKVEHISKLSELENVILSNKALKTTSKDISRIQKSLVSKKLLPESKNVFDIDYHACSEYVNAVGNTDGGVFVRMLETRDGKSKTVIQRAFLREHEQKTAENSKDAFGADYADKGKILFSMIFSIKRGESAFDGLEESMIDDHNFEEYDDGDDELDDEEQKDLEEGPVHEHSESDALRYTGLASNYVERWNKVGFRKLFDWGPGFKLIYRSHAYDIDMDFFGSLPVGKSKCLRRKYIVRDGDGQVVAKMKEVNVLKKVPPLYDNDWEIDIYRRDLARDEFGYVLTLMTQYLRSDNLYDQNACEKALKIQRAKIERTEATI
ncbi:hypothetical protein COV11_00960 [Candidatus Woesearchaeota archaeon CG10_big_fil_rev_8_21_14_0_10_30_7]|nr:MAG: hypothetical protein COV11_00960 [Candidatus Woesearchaeota archaeon CG10_big_fil_rev_8_21_14_0_10_30_7]